MTSAVRPARAIPSQVYIARFAAERARLQRHYCNLFEFWRACRDKRCRRALRCCGDASDCLKSRIGEIPRHAQFLAREAVLVSTPHNAGGAERTVRPVHAARRDYSGASLPVAMSGEGGATRRVVEGASERVAGAMTSKPRNAERPAPPPPHFVRSPSPGHHGGGLRCADRSVYCYRNIAGALGCSMRSANRSHALRRITTLGFATLALCLSAPAALAFSVSFDWCPQGSSPNFTLHDVPHGTVNLRFAMTDLDKPALPSRRRHGRLSRPAGSAVRCFRLGLHRPDAAARRGAHLRVQHPGAGAGRHRARRHHGAEEISGVRDIILPRTAGEEPRNARRRGQVRAPILTFKRARKLRTKMSLPEVLLWQALRSQHMAGLRFRRQHPVGPYILDFYRASARLAVEIDGTAHDSAEQTPP